MLIRKVVLGLPRILTLLFESDKLECEYWYPVKRNK